MCDQRGCVSYSVVLGVYVLMDVVVNLRNKYLHWFCGKRTFIDGGVYMRFNGGVGLRITSSAFI